MQVLEEQVEKQQLQKPIVKKKKQKIGKKRISASRKAYLERIKATPYIENINIIDVWRDESKGERCHFCDCGDEKLEVDVLPMLELCIPNYKMVLRICFLCIGKMNKFLLSQKRKIETYEQLISARLCRHYIHSQEDWDSMTDEERKATGCAYPAIRSDTGWEKEFVRNNLRKSVNKEMYIDTRVDAKCPKCNHTWKCRSKLDFIQCSNCRVISQREDIIVDSWEGQKLDMDLIDKRLEKLKLAGKL